MENFLNESTHQHLFGLTIEPDTLFSNHKNIFKKGIKKRQSKLAEKITYLKRFLGEDEKIVCITTGCSPMSFLDQWLMGIWIYSVKRCLLVFTNKRILHIPTMMDYSFRNSIAHILYADCQSIMLKGRTLVVKYANKDNEKFYYIAGKEKKKIKAFLATVSLEGQQSAMQARTHLCPRCTDELIVNEYTCPSCQLEFKNKVECKKISIFYPGGGYFYTRHPVMGVCDAIVEIFLSSSIVLSLIDAAKGVEGSVILAIVLGILLAIEKVITVHDSNKFINEYIPMEKNIDVESVMPRENQGQGNQRETKSF